jgi:hypothetical protein
MVVDVLTVGRIGGWFSAAWDIAEGSKVCLDLYPTLRVFFSDDWGVWIGVISLNIFLNGGRDGLCRLKNETVKKIGIGLIGERIATRFDDTSSVKISIRKRMAGVAGLARDVLLRSRSCGQGTGRGRVRVRIGSSSA